VAGTWRDKCFCDGDRGRDGVTAMVVVVVVGVGNRGVMIYHFFF